MLKITEDTLIPLGKAIGILMVLVGGIGWLTNIAYSVAAHGKAIDDIRIAQIKYNEAVIEISRDLAVIKFQLEGLKEEKTRRR